MVGGRLLLAACVALEAPASASDAGLFRGAQTVRNANANSNSNADKNANANAGQSVATENLDMSKNPVRKVVTLLQNLAKKIEKEAEQEKELYEKFMCYCKNAGGQLATSIADSTAKVPQVQSDIESSEAQVVQYKADVKKHQTDRADVVTAMAEATSLRDKEHAEFAKENGETTAYVASLDKAIPAVQNGMAGSAALLQSSSAVAELQRAAASDRIDLTDDDREAVTAFLSGTVASAYGYVPKGGEILGILKTMREDFAKTAQKLQDDEAQAVETYDELIAAKTKEEKSLTGSILKKTQRIGELAVAIISMKDELTDTEEALIEDQKLQGSLGTDCDSKQKEFEQRVATRGQELAAVSDTIKVLNDDDALELFKKTLPGASAAGALMQVKSGEQQMKQRAISLLHKATSARDALDGPDVRFIELALTGGKVDFSKVIKMIDEMVAILAEEQMDDNHKKEYCGHQLDYTDDKLKTLTGTESDLETSIEDGKTTFAQLEEDIKALVKGISELDKSILDVTEQRKEENEEYTELMSSNTAAKELLEFAKNRLNKFYNPKLYKAPPKRELSEEDRISLNMGATMAPTEAPGGIAGTGIGFMQISQHGKDEPEAAPETWEKGYKKKSEESNGVMAMIDLLVRDLDKEMTEAETQERDSQAAYEGLMHDSAVKRAKDTKLMTEKQATKADTEEALVKSDGELMSTRKELMATKQYEGQLHGECDWLLKYFDLRKTARFEESDNLKKAKATLLGADFSLLQQQSPALGFLAEVKRA